MRILIVEDEMRLAEVIKKGLTEDGFAVDLAHDGEEGQYLAESEKYDLNKLIRMCKELNDNYSLNNYLACGMLIRAILDHVPPIFDKKTFPEVANNYGTKSFRDIVLPLEDTARKISDSYLHNPIRKKELLPNKTQVSFQPNMDVLLSEIVRVLSADSK